MKQVLRFLAWVAVSASLLLLIAWTFWQQEVQYLLPTPVPSNYKVVSPGQLIAFNKQQFATATASQAHTVALFQPLLPVFKVQFAAF